MGLFHPWRTARRARLAREVFPPEWAWIIDRNVPACRMLGDEERRRLEGLIRVFVAEKRFEGCAGIEVTDEMRVTIAAQACLLLLNLRHDFYGRLYSILIHPQAFLHLREEGGPAGTVETVELPVSGLSSSSGAIAVSWPDALAGGRDPADGMNVVFHEFAHQLDLLDGEMNGTPALSGGRSYRNWARVLGRTFDELRAATHSGLPTLLGDYAATRPAEFFAVVTELFFERPGELRRAHPELYNAFRAYFGQDPGARGAAP